MEQNKVKILFSVIIVIIVMLVAGGSMALDSRSLAYLNRARSLKVPYLPRWATIVRSWNYLEDKIAYSHYSGTSMLAAILPIQRILQAKSNSNITPTAGVPVLLYHGILTRPVDPATDGTESITLDDFRQQMFALKQAGWQTIKIDDLYNYIHNGEPLPAHSFLLTFDDGRKDSYYNADPVLEALDYNAVMFVITGQSIPSKSNYYLNQKELTEMLASGRWQLEAHTQNGHGYIPIDAQGDKGYFFTNKMWLADQNRLETDQEYTRRITQDLDGVKSDLEQTFGIPVNAFAFPFNDFGQDSKNFPQSIDILHQAVSERFQMAFFQTAPGIRYNAEFYDQNHTTDGSYFLKRILMTTGVAPAQLLSKVNNASGKQLPYSENFDGNRGWISTWGQDNFNGSQLVLTPDPQSTGSVVVLDGSRPWQDYSLTANVQWSSGSNIYLWSRFQDDNNYLSCNFGKDLVHIEQTVNGQKKVIKGVSITLPYPDNTSFNIGMDVQGRTATCLFNGQPVVSSPFVDASLDSGGIGLKAWSAVPDQSKLIVKQLDVKNI